MKALGLNPVLNVSDLQASFAWFEQWGWRKLWDFHTPPTFGAVGSGKTVIFLCQNGQGGRGRGANTTTFQHEGDTQADQGVWMSVWVDDAVAVYQQCLTAGLDITFPPTDMPWGARETHLRHPDGHVFRISQNLELD
ncbi:bleomycin resistance family protein [Terriglobus aquaticus]|uniref:Bleomycin resistance family protein n=1 Tax=Terriglobus aquaticus TaxID=940139 RepID=A0ABW9KK74_9BACT|nr:bleomycin resistance family protein [Terriglobus aquaticus]